MEAAHEGVAGKTARLVAAVEAHRAELAFDFRHLLGLPVSEIGVSVPWAEAVDLVDQIAARPGTHYWSALQGFTGPTSYPDLATILHAQAFLNRYRPKGTDPVKLPLPIPDAKPESDVTPEERDELIAYARATAPFSLDD